MSQNVNKHILQIDGLRCFAVLSVLIAHFIVGNYGGETLNKIPFGTGVNLFFVISGFLITSILLQKKEAIYNQTTTFFKEIKNFYVRRTLRIFPLYYIVLLFVVYFSFDQIKDYYGYLFTYTTNIYMIIHNGYIGSKTHLWSLAVEEQFYLIWPFVILLVPKKSILLFILSIILLSLISKYYFLNLSPYTIGSNASFTSCLDSLGLGALLAHLQLNHLIFFKKLVTKKALILSIILYIILFLFPCILSENLESLLKNTFTSIIYFFLVGLASQNKFSTGVKALLENKISLYLGKISYGIYLIHNFMPEAFEKFFAQKLPPTDHLSMRIVYWILLTIALASTSWYLIEKPILRLKKYF